MRKGTGTPKSQQEWQRRKKNESSDAKTNRLTRSRSYHKEHRDEQIKSSRKWRDDHYEESLIANREWHRKYGKDYMKKRRTGLIGPFSKADGPDWKFRNREHFLALKRESANRRNREITVEGLKHYGGDNPRCYCCGESELLLLGLDHIAGGGAKHRKETGMRNTSGWAKNNNWPPIFRVACHSCNLGSHLNGGTCPHQKV